MEDRIFEEVVEDETFQVGAEWDFSEIEIKEFLDSLEGRTKAIAISLYSGFKKSEVAELEGITSASVSYHVKRIQRAYRAYCII